MKHLTTANLFIIHLTFLSLNNLSNPGFFVLIINAALIVTPPLPPPLAAPLNPHQLSPHRHYPHLLMVALPSLEITLPLIGLIQSSSTLGGKIILNAKINSLISNVMLLSLPMKGHYSELIIAELLWI
jgi:hypothetical protein